MKRTIFLRTISTILIVGYLTLTIVSAIIPFIPFYKFWFSLFIGILGITLLLRYCCYKIDASLFAGIILFLCGTIGILNFYLNFAILYIISLYISSFGLASFAIFIKFRQVFHLKLFVFTILCDIVLIVYAGKLCPLWLFIASLAVIVLSTLILVITSIKANTRKI